MMPIDVSPTDDPEIPCEMRLWTGTHIVVFVHPRKWKQVAIVDGTPMFVTSCGKTFRCRIRNVGEHHRSGSPEDIHATDFGVHAHADYPATARIDWLLAVPELFKQGLEDSAELTQVWRSLSSDEMRAHLSHIFRARRPGVMAERQFALLRRLSELNRAPKS